jgi:glycosyltransferase involved in cell wall biosynthesis
VISVVIPTRDRADKLARALASVVAQSEPAGEVIVVDDGSSAEEAARIAALVENTPGARLLQNACSLGAAQARNLAAAEARGDLLAFLDSDDWWVPHRLAAHAAVLGRSGAVLSYNPARLTRSGVGSAVAPSDAPRRRGGRCRSRSPAGTSSAAAPAPACRPMHSGRSVDSTPTCRAARIGTCGCG